MAAMEYDSHIRCCRINQMMDHLAELLRAPKGAFRYQEGTYTSSAMSHKTVSDSSDANAVVISNCDGKAAWRFLANLTLNEAALNIQSNGGVGQFYNYHQSIWHTPETIAYSTYDRLCQRVFIDFEAILGFRFLDITGLSEMTYEGDAAYGSLLFLPSGTAVRPQCDILLSGHKRVLLERSQLKYIRKLLAGTEVPDKCGKDRQGLVFIQEHSGEKYYCAGYISEKNADQFPVRASMKGNGKWTLALAGQDILDIRGSQVRFTRNPIEESRDALKSELHICSESEWTPNDPPCFERYEQFLMTLSRQHHGTSAVFLNFQDKAVADWINNLEVRCRAQRVEPLSVLDLKPDDFRSAAVRGISRIDGCFIVNYVKGTLEFINVIVDGLAVVDGSLASGSRRNSIPCFLANLARACPGARSVAFLFSEDGEVSVVRGSELERQLTARVP